MFWTLTLYALTCRCKGVSKVSVLNYPDDERVMLAVNGALKGQFPKYIK